MGHYQGGPGTGHLRGGGGRGEGQVVLGDVEEFRRVFRAGFVGHGGADALVAVWTR